MDKRQELHDIISELSSNKVKEEKDLLPYINRLDSLYKDKYRHFYSDIFACIRNNTQEKNVEKNVILAENISYIYKYIEKNDYTDHLRKSVTKLYDHVSLELARLKHADIKLEKSTQQVYEDLDNIKKEAKLVRNKISKLQTEYTVILGIFSAIVITFVAGLVFTSSVLANIEKSSIYRLILCLWIIGFVLVNVLNHLFCFIYNLIKKDIHQLLLNIKILNVIFILGMILILLFWIFDIRLFRDILILKVYAI